MIHLSEAIVGIKKKPQRIGTIKRFCDLKIGGEFWYAQKHKNKIVDLIRYTVAREVDDIANYDVYTPDSNGSPIELHADKCREGKQQENLVCSSKYDGIQLPDYEYSYVLGRHGDWDWAFAVTKEDVYLAFDLKKR